MASSTVTHSFWCIIDGQTSVFEVNISEPADSRKKANIDHLKNAINEKLKRTTASKDLTLWRVAIPIPPPKQQRAITLSEVKSPTELDPSDDISDVFTSHPPRKTIRVIVQLPSQDSSSKKTRLNTSELKDAIEAAGLTEKAVVNGRAKLSRLNNKERVSLLDFIGQEVNEDDEFDSLTQTAFALRNANIKDRDKFSTPSGTHLPIVGADDLYIRRTYSDLYDKILEKFESSLEKQIVITDSSPKPVLSQARTVISASTKILFSETNKYQDVDKEVAWRYYMVPWKMEELKMCRSCVADFKVVPLKLVQELYSKIGGVPMYVLARPMKELRLYPNNLETAKERSCERLAQALERVQNPVVMMQLFAQGKDSLDFSSHLVHRWPSQDHRSFRLEWASKHVAEKVADLLNQDSCTQMLTMLINKPDGTASGIIFEAYVLRTFRDGGHTFEIKDLQTKKIFSPEDPTETKGKPLPGDFLD
ncbi:hypothetical protein BGZ83_008662 [Gryganskiella cystojenkinii]|nr:hypothetical protein BGZ83_008662 [Gryganskiella cystojenkinii]